MTEIEMQIRQTEAKSKLSFSETWTLEYMMMAMV